MADSDTQLILQAIKAQGDKIGSLADAVNRLAEKGGRNGWQTIAMVVLLIGAFNALQFTMMGGVRDDVNGLRAAMAADDAREAEDRKAFSGLDERFAEVETQFRCASTLAVAREAHIWDAIRGTLGGQGYDSKASAGLGAGDCRAR